MKRYTVRTMCQCALLVALEIVLNRFGSIQTPFLKIGLSFVAVAMGGILFGPVGGAVVGGLGDLVGALAFPSGVYHPGFTLCAAAMGAVYGYFLHLNSRRFDNGEKQRFWPNVVLPVVFSALLGLFLNTLWISQLYSSKSYWGYFISRVPQELGLGAVKLAVIPLLAPLARQLRRLGIVRYER